jgi:hypothetical protein
MTSLTDNAAPPRGVAVHLRHDHAVDLQRLVERLGGLDGVLAGHRVDDQERVVGLDRGRDLADLLHHLGVDRQAAGGVDDHDVTTEALGLFEPGGGGPHRIARVGEHRHVDLAAERAQLLDSGGTLQVGADEQRLAALALEPAGQLGRVGGLAGTLETRHQHHGGRLGRVGDRERLAAERPRQLVVDRLDDLLGGIEGRRTRRADGGLADAVADRAHHGDVDVGFEERRTDLLHHLVDVGLGETTLAADLLDDAFEPC